MENRIDEEHVSKKQVVGMALLMLIFGVIAIVLNINIGVLPPHP